MIFRYYLIVVIEAINEKPKKEPKEYEFSDLKLYKDYIDQRKNGIFIPYIAAMIYSKNFPTNGTFVLGSGTRSVRKQRSTENEYFNGPLMAEAKYFVFQRTHVNKVIPLF